METPYHQINSQKYMKRILYIFIFILVNIISSIAQDTTYIYYNGYWSEIKENDDTVFFRKQFVDNGIYHVQDYYFEDSIIQMTGYYETKKTVNKNGHFVYYFKNGKKSSEGEYKNSTKTGKWTTWFENGQKKETELYKKDKLNGKCSYWHKNGQKRAEGVNIENLAEEIWTYWNKNGNIKAEGSYKKGLKEGKWSYWYENGNISSFETMKKDKIISTTSFYQNGFHEYEGNYINEKQDGEWKYWNINNRLFLVGSFKKGLREGDWYRIFRNGDFRIQYRKGVIINETFGGLVRNK